MRPIAAMQQGLIRRDQLLAAGAGRGSVDGGVRRRELTVVRRGVYRVGPIAGPLAEELAVVLATRSPTWISHGSATHLHFLGSTEQPRPTPIHVTTVGVRPQLRGVVAHHTSALPDDEVCEIRGVPVTSIERAIVDLASLRAPHTIERLIGEAFALRKTNRAALLGVAERYPGRPGAGLVRRILDAARKPNRFRSRPERELAALLGMAGLKRPHANARIGAWEVDLLWREERVVVEFDAYSTHSGRDRFERDRRKDAELALDGYLVIRVTGRQLADEREAVVARVAAALAMRAAA